MEISLDIPKDRPRPSRWLPPLLAALIVLFIIALQPLEASLVAERAENGSDPSPANTRF